MTVYLVNYNTKSAVWMKDHSVAAVHLKIMHILGLVLLSCTTFSVSLSLDYSLKMILNSEFVARN